MYHAVISIKNIHIDAMKIKFRVSIDRSERFILMREKNGIEGKKSTTAGRDKFAGGVDNFFGPIQRQPNMLRAI